MTVLAYVGAGCPRCDRPVRRLMESGRPYRLVRVTGPDHELSEAYPTMACSTCREGVTLPFFTEEDGTLIGDAVDLLDYLSSVPVPGR